MRVPPVAPRFSEKDRSRKNQRDCLICWCRVRDLNSRPTVYKDSWAHRRNLDGIGLTSHVAPAAVVLFVVPAARKSCPRHVRSASPFASPLPRHDGATPGKKDRNFKLDSI